MIVRRHPAVLHFVVVAKDFCTLLETGRAERPCKVFIEDAIRVVLDLYHAALDLPDVTPERPKKAERLPVRERLDRHLQRSRKLRDSIQPRITDSLGGERCYSRVFDPFDPKDPQTVTATLLDDLSDIYIDVKAGLQQIDDREELLTRRIVWEWKFGMESHWGWHATGAIYAMHWLLKGLAEDEILPG